MRINATITVPADRLTVETDEVEVQVPAKQGEGYAYSYSGTMNIDVLWPMVQRLVGEAYNKGHIDGMKDGSRAALDACKQAAQGAGLELTIDLD